jgi:hypothetical protein
LISGVQSFICANGCKSSFLILSSGVSMFICVKSCHILILISGVQLFAYMNDCKSCFDFDFIFWHAIVCMCKQLQVIFCFGFYFLVCNHSHIQTIASHLKKFKDFLACHHSYVRMIASYICFGFYFLVCNCSYVRTIASHILILFSV